MHVNRLVPRTIRRRVSNRCSASPSKCTGGTENSLLRDRTRPSPGCRGHVLEVAAGEPWHVRELGSQVVGEPVDHAGSPALSGLTVHNRPTDRPVQAQQLGVDDAMRAQLRASNLGLESGQQVAVAGSLNPAAHAVPLA